MSDEAIIMSMIALSLSAFYVVRWIRTVPVPPDPWESEISPTELESTDTRVCVNCLTPVATPGQHYCPACGNATGEFTPYIPFVNIRFNYSLFATLWARIRSPDVRLRSKAVAIGVILVGAPAMLIVGLPILLYCRLRTKPNEQVHGTA